MAVALPDLFLDDRFRPLRHSDCRRQVAERLLLRRCALSRTFIMLRAVGYVLTCEREVANAKLHNQRKPPVFRGNLGLARPQPQQKVVLRRPNIAHLLDL